jgi:replicative DNA helicase
MEPQEIFDLIVKADEKLKYATAARGDQRAKQAADLLQEAMREAEAIGNDALVQQAKVRLADLDALMSGGSSDEDQPGPDPGT